MQTTASLQETIELAAYAAYTYVGEYKYLPPQDIHALPQCRMVTDSMLFDLREAGVDVVPISRGGDLVDEHRYLKLGTSIIDATWQQFLPPDVIATADDLPQVYVGSREGLQDLAQLHGADPRAIKLWDEDGPSRNLTPQEKAELYQPGE